MRSKLRIGWFSVAAVAAMGAALAQQPQFIIKTKTEVVLVDVAVRDAQGHLVRGLTADDFLLTEDGKPQKVLSFDFEDVERGMATAAAAAGPAGTLTAGAPGAALAGAGSAAAPAYRDRRLWLLYFDLTTMQPEDVATAEESAEEFIRKQMTPADLVAVATLGNSLQVTPQFSGDRDQLLREIHALDPTSGEAFAAGDDGSTQTGNAFIADSTEFNIVSADRSLVSIQSLCAGMAKIQQKKALVFISSGIQRSGVDNEITLRSAVNACVKADVAIYGVDARGLEATPPGGGATAAAPSGTSAYDGSIQTNAVNSLLATQETIATLSNDTGGRSFLDANTFTSAFAQAAKDTQAYYLLSYTSSNPNRDGKYRKIAVRMKRPGLTVNARAGYYANRDLQHLSNADREAQLQDEMDATVMDHSLDLYLTDGFLRLDRDRYYVPVSVAIPGAEIPLQGLDPKATPEVDLTGEVLGANGQKLSHVSQNIKLDARLTGPGGQLQSKNLQFDTGFVLAPGQQYEIRFAARENQTGEMGAFQSTITVPDFETAGKAAGDLPTLAISAVLAGNQLADAKPGGDNPMNAGGKALVPSVSHVFAANQHLYVYFEVYDPKLNAQGGIALKTDVAFFQGRAKAFESAPVTVTSLSDPKRKAAVVQLDLPLDTLKPGYYTCQVNAVDEVAGRVAFPRFPILVKAVK